MLKIEIPMFYTYVFYIEGNPKQIDRQLKSILKKYGMIRRNGETTAGLTKDINGKMLSLIKDEESTIDIGGNFTKACVIAFNTESNTTSFKSINKKKSKIGTVSHEIRHVVDRIVRCHNITDMETPAYLTGWLSSEILSTVI